MGPRKPITWDDSDLTSTRSKNKQSKTIKKTSGKPKTHAKKSRTKDFVISVGDSKRSTRIAKITTKKLHIDNDFGASTTRFSTRAINKTGRLDWSSFLTVNKGGDDTFDRIAKGGIINQVKFAPDERLRHLNKSQTDSSIQISSSPLPKPQSKVRKKYQRRKKVPLLLKTSDAEIKKTRRGGGKITTSRNDDANSSSQHEGLEVNEGAWRAAMLPGDNTSTPLVFRTRVRSKTPAARVRLESDWKLRNSPRVHLKRSAVKSGVGSPKKTSKVSSDFDNREVTGRTRTSTKKSSDSSELPMARRLRHVVDSSVDSIVADEVSSGRRRSSAKKIDSVSIVKLNDTTEHGKLSSRRVNRRRVAVIKSDTSINDSAKTNDNHKSWSNSKIKSHDFDRSSPMDKTSDGNLTDGSRRVSRRHGAVTRTQTISQSDKDSVKSNDRHATSSATPEFERTSQTDTTADSSLTGSGRRVKRRRGADTGIDSSVPHSVKSNSMSDFERTGQIDTTAGSNLTDDSGRVKRRDGAVTRNDSISPSDKNSVKSNDSHAIADSEESIQFDSYLTRSSSRRVSRRRGPVSHSKTRSNFVVGSEDDSNVTADNNSRRVKRGRQASSVKSTDGFNKRSRGTRRFTKPRAVKNSYDASDSSSVTDSLTDRRIATRQSVQRTSGRVAKRSAKVTPVTTLTDPDGSKRTVKRSTNVTTRRRGTDTSSAVTRRTSSTRSSNNPTSDDVTRRSKPKVPRSRSNTSSSDALFKTPKPPLKLRRNRKTSLESLASPILINGSSCQTIEAEGPSDAGRDKQRTIESILNDHSYCDSSKVNGSSCQHVSNDVLIDHTYSFSSLTPPVEQDGGDKQTPSGSVIDDFTAFENKFNAARNSVIAENISKRTNDTGSISVYDSDDVIDNSQPSVLAPMPLLPKRQQPLSFVKLPPGKLYRRSLFLLRRPNCQSIVPDVSASETEQVTPFSKDKTSPSKRRTSGDKSVDLSRSFGRRTSVRFVPVGVVDVTGDERFLTGGGANDSLREFALNFNSRAVPSPPGGPPDKKSHQEEDSGGQEGYVAPPPQFSSLTLDIEETGERTKDDGSHGHGNKVRSHRAGGDVNNEEDESVDDGRVEIRDFARLSIVQDKNRRNSPNSIRNIRAATAEDVVLQKCQQREVLPFAQCYNESTLRNCHKIGEGVFGEVFLYKSAGDNGARPSKILKDKEKDVQSATTVMKIIPIEGDLLVNGEKQKRYDEILSEIVIATELSNLQDAAPCFSRVKAVKCVTGRYPDRLLELWDLYDENYTSENDSPAVFPDDQKYVVLELANGGKDMEAFVFNNAQQVHALFQQVAYSLAVAESELKFEHRDLHWGNVLIAQVERNKKVKFRLQGRTHEVNTRGVEATIIDFTLSRVEVEGGVVIYNDLAADPDLFGATGDYQFEIYRMMQKSNGNNWQHFQPFSNVLWLHYLLHKALTAIRYKNTSTKIHGEYLKKLKVLKDDILSFGSVVEFVNDSFFED